jgi:hypothetical protein
MTGFVPSPTLVRVNHSTKQTSDPLPLLLQLEEQRDCWCHCRHGGGTEASFGKLEDASMWDLTPPGIG